MLTKRNCNYYTVIISILLLLLYFILLLSNYIIIISVKLFEYNNKSSITFAEKVNNTLLNKNNTLLKASKTKVLKAEGCLFTE